MDWFFDLSEKTRAKIFIGIIACLAVAVGIFVLTGNNGDNASQNNNNTSKSATQSPTPNATQKETTKPSTKPTSSPTMTITPIPVKEDLFSGPLPVPANQLNEIARNSTKVGAVLENHSISYDKKTQELQGIATKTIMNSSNIGTDEDVPLKPTVGFVQIVTLAPDVIVTKISVNNKPRYVSFIKINGQWTANAYNADIMNNQN